MNAKDTKSVLSFMFKKDQTYFKKSCGVNTTRFLKYDWPLFKIMNESVKMTGS